MEGMPTSMGDPHLISLKPGTVIAERYEVVKCLGAGSMGLVYACQHTELTGHKVAVKVLFPEVANDPVAAARFKNEIFASYDVSHPNVVRAYEYLRDGDIVAYTMEFVNGGDLAHRMESGDPLPIDECTQVLCQMCAGVQAIHDAGIVHRDLKPENILLTKDGVVKIADFGIARTGHGPRLTEHGGVVGTIDYVSPEYMLNSQVDWRSDIYAMGILAYEMVAGESPFRGESVYATMTKRLKSDPKPPSSINPLVPPELDRIILKAMARGIDDRYQSASAMFADLQPLLPENPVMPSGAFLQVQRPKSESYEGPILSPGDSGYGDVEDETSEFETDTASAASRSDDSTVESGGYSAVKYSAMDAPDLLKETQVVPSGIFTSQKAKSSKSKKIGTPEVVPIASQYGAENSEAMRFVSSEHTIAVRTGRSAGNHRPSAAHSGTAVRSSGMRHSSQFSSGTVERGVWTEILTLIVAILIGVGLGFFLVKMFFPNLLGLEDVALQAREFFFV